MPANSAHAIGINPSTGVLTIPYRINVNSFTTSGNVNWARNDFYVGDDSLWVWLINTAASTWRVNTGANGKVIFDYQGVDNTHTAGIAGWGDGYNVIGAVPSSSSLCIGGAAYCLSVGINEYTEWDVFCCTQNGQWGIDLALTAASGDIIQTIGHEIGHGLSVGHAGGGALCTMQPEWGTGQTHSRHQFGFDVAQFTEATSPYGMSCLDGGASSCGPTYEDAYSVTQPLGTQSLNVYVREYLEGYGWSTEFQVPSVTSGIAPAAAIGRLGEHGGAMAVATTTTGGYLQLKYAQYPVHENSSWFSSSYANSAFDNSWRPAPPAIAARDTGEPRWLVARPIMQDQLVSTNCGGIQIWSTEDFSSASAPYLLGAGTGADRICTNQPISLTYDPMTDRFLLFWLTASDDFDTSYGIPHNAQIHLRISTDGDGNDWEDDGGAPGITALAVPTAACARSVMGSTFLGDANCQLQYPMGYWTEDPFGDPTYYPFVHEISFHVDTTSGGIGISGMGLDWNWTSRPTSAAATTIMEEPRFWSGMMWTGDMAKVAHGTATLQVHADWTLPATTNSSFSTGIESDHRVSLVGSANTERLYAVYVNP